MQLQEILTNMQEAGTSEALLDSARGCLDVLESIDETVEAIGMLLEWSQVWAGKHAAPARRERCRLVSYASIMHGCALLPSLPHIARLIAPLLGDTDALVAEELQRTVGNLTRYVLAAHGSGPRLPPDVLSLLIAPILGASSVTSAEESSSYSALCRASFLAVHRVLLELPQ